MALPRRVMRVMVIARAVWVTTGQRHVGLIAAGVAFYAFFGLFPGLAAVITLWGYFYDPKVILTYLERTHEIIPDDAYLLIQSQVNALVGAHLSTLGWASVVSFGVALYASRAGVEALLQGLNAIHGCPPRRIGHSFLLASVFTVFLILVVLIALTTVVGMSILIAFLPLMPRAESLVTAGMPWAVMFLVVMGGLGALYRYGPSCAWGRQRWISWGAVFAALSWALASLAFSAYLSRFGAYNRIYGSIGAVIALMMWFYISAYAVLVGAAINAETPHKPRRNKDQ